MLVSDLQPASVVEDVGFQRLLKVVDPKYELPSRRTIMRELLPTLYKKRKQELLETLAKADYCALTTDLWTSRTTCYMTVTCHYITDEWSFDSAVLSTINITEAHTSVNLASELTTLSEKWNIVDKVCCMTTDNASNITNAIKSLEWNHLPCFAHTLNLIVTKALDEVPELSTVISKVKNVVSFFHRSTKATDKLYDIQARLNIFQHKLIQHVETRWNSVYFMLERYLEQEEAIRTTLCLLHGLF